MRCPADRGSFEHSDHGKNSENGAPYTLAGDNDDGYLIWAAAVGNHELTATPFSGRHGTGSEGESLTVRFEIKSGSPETAAESWLLYE